MGSPKRPGLSPKMNRRRGGSSHSDDGPRYCGCLSKRGATILGSVVLLLFILTIKTDNWDTWWPNWGAQYFALDYGYLGKVASLTNKYASKHQDFAAKFYEEQRPIVLESARNFNLHWYWAETATNVKHKETSYYNMAWNRVSALVTRFERDKQDGFRIEKDKCAMYQFFEMNKLPSPPVLGYWDSTDTFLTDLASGKAYSQLGVKDWHWPIVIKFCHLTQGWALSSKLIKNEQEIQNTWNNSLKEWVEEKWALWPDDPHRPWREEANILGNGLTRGVMLQAGGDASWNEDQERWTMVELKIEVIWGHAVLANIEFDNKKAETGKVRADDGKKHDRSTYATGIVTRLPGGKARIELFRSLVDTVFRTPVPLDEGSWYDFISEEGHLDCAFPLAERTARLASADNLRVDVFLTKGKPKNCMVNEDSLTSGSLYVGHMTHLAQLWSEPFLLQVLRSCIVGVSYSLRNSSPRAFSFTVLVVCILHRARCDVVAL
eukprot:m.889017 g.889017  ORF g.889017 m.889017 type:complete len:491 (-) comp23642_c0_seq1:575-2047(-)